MKIKSLNKYIPVVQICHLIAICYSVQLIHLLCLVQVARTFSNTAQPKIIFVMLMSHHTLIT